MLSRRHHVLSALMVSALATFCGCGGSTEVGVDDIDAGDETIAEAGDETSVDTGSGDDTGTGDDTGSPDDTGTPDDTAVPTDTDVDSGTPTDTDVDSGTPTDTGTPTDSTVTDTGTPPTDTGTPPTDTGTPPTDTGTIVDTGTDTGTVVDTGPETPATGTCSAVSITTAGYTDTHVRQGAGPIAIKVTGTGLAGTTAVSFGTVVCSAVVATATQVTANCTIPHGATLGATNITLNGGAIATCVSGATIDKITVNAATGNDTNVGSSTKPYKSIKQGLSVAASGDIVDVKAGTYSTPATAETWVNTIGMSPFGVGITPNVAAGVTIEGDPAGGTKLVATGVGPATATTTALLLAGAATLKDLNLDGFKWGVAASTGNVSLTNVVITNSSQDGIIGQAGATGSLNVTLSAAAAGSGMTKSKCLLEGNNVGFRFSGASTTATLTNCDVISNGSAGGISMADAALTTTSTRFQTNGTATSAGIASPFGGGGNIRIGLAIEGTTAKLTMTGGEITGSYDYGLVGYGPNAIKLTNLVVQNNGKAVGSGANSGAAFATSGTAASFGTLDISGGDFSSNGFDGISVAGAFDVTLLGTSIKTNGTTTGGFPTNAGLRFSSTGTISAKGITVTGNVNEQIIIGDGAAAATKIEFLDNGPTPTTISRTGMPSLTIPLVRDQRPTVAGGGTTIQFAKATLFQGATMPSATYTPPPNDVFNGVPATALIFHINSTGRKIQVL